MTAAPAMRTVCTRAAGRAADGERGSAMIVVATLMGLVAALAAGLSLGASTVALVSGNHAAMVQTRAAADAGAEHALSVVLDVLPRWWSHGLASPAEALPDLLARGRLWREAEAAGFPSGSRAFGGASYTVAVLDDDAAERGLGPADIAAIGEDGDRAHDANGRVVIRAVATGPRGASATVDAVLALVPLPAALLRGGARIGAATLAGRVSDLHVAGDLEVDGLVAAGTVEATGRLAAAVRPGTGARVGGQARRLPFPDIRPEPLRAVADVVLRSDGAVGDAAGVAICLPGGTCPASSAAWTFAAGTWTLTAPPPVPVTVFVEGDAVLDAGSAAPDPVRLSLVASGSVLVRGAFPMRPAARGVLIVAGGDVRIDGALDADAEDGLIAAGEQVGVVGPARIRGSVLAAGRSHGSPLVAANTIANGAVVTSDGALAAAGFSTWRVTGWRRVQAW